MPRGLHNGVGRGWPLGVPLSVAHREKIKVGLARAYAEGKMRRRPQEYGKRECRKREYLQVRVHYYEDGCKTADKLIGQLSSCLKCRFCSTNVD